MPAHALAPEPDWEVIDACAAPGNKTTHVAALLLGKSMVWAFDRDPKRLQRLQKNTAAAGAHNITAQKADFMLVKLTEPRFAAVKGLLLDPSCSGSGTAHSRMDHLLQSTQHEENSAEDADGREKALRHALTLPSLQRLVYSTCSVHQQENEDVVKAVLPEAEKLGFKLHHALPAWSRRGLPVFQGAEKLIRTDADLDGTDGFFVACFERCTSPAPSSE
eukprot:jgi/Astpho2/2839/e_gw1.00050.188.1_t